jgi:biotin operon repressor
MSVAELTINPKSVDEIQDSLNHWLAASPRGAQARASIRIKRVSPSEGRLVISSEPLRGIRFLWESGALVFEEGRRRVDFRLDHFDVNAEVDAKQIRIVFKLRHQTSFRPLRESLSSVEKTKHPTLMSRVLKAVDEIVQGLSTERIEEATSAPSDYLVLLNAMTAPTVVTQLTDKDPLAAAKLRGTERQQTLVKSGGGVLSAEETAHLLGISRQAVDKRRRQGQLIGLTQGRRGYAYPAWQFENGKTIEHLQKVLHPLREHDPWMQLSFFLNANDRLNGITPLQALRAGDVEQVAQAAQAYGEQGAA